MCKNKFCTLDSLRDYILNSESAIRCKLLGQEVYYEASDYELNNIGLYSFHEYKYDRKGYKYELNVTSDFFILNNFILELDNFSENINSIYNYNINIISLGNLSLENNIFHVIDQYIVDKNKEFFKNYSNKLNIHFRRLELDRGLINYNFNYIYSDYFIVSLEVLENGLFNEFFVNYYEKLKIKDMYYAESLFIESSELLSFLDCFQVVNTNIVDNLFYVCEDAIYMDIQDDSVLLLEASLRQIDNLFKNYNKYSHLFNSLIYIVDYDLNIIIQLAKKYNLDNVLVYDNNDDMGYNFLSLVNLV